MPGRYQVRAAPFLDLNYASLLARLGARRKLLTRSIMTTVPAHGPYYEYNGRGYAVLPGVDIRCHDR